MKLEIPLKNTKPTKFSPIKFIRKIIFLIKIEGESGWPILVPGKSYLATNLVRPKIRDFVVFRNPKNNDEIFVKRVKTIQSDCYFVEGIIPWSESSNDFGLVHKKSILGKIILN